MRINYWIRYAIYIGVQCCLLIFTTVEFMIFWLTIVMFAEVNYLNFEQQK